MEILTVSPNNKSLTLDVTGRRSNELIYDSALKYKFAQTLCGSR